MLRSVAFFSELSEEDALWFLERGRHADYPKGSLLFQHGDPADSLFLILEGWVKIYQDNAEGDQTVLAVLTRGDTFGEESVVKGRAYPCNAQSISRHMRCLILPAAALREKVRAEPDIALSMISALSDQVNRMGFLLAFYSNLTSSQRVAAFVLKLALENGGAQTVQFPYNKLMVAARLGMQPETFSRALRKLEDEEIVVIKGREIDISSLDGLQIYCSVSCCANPECSLNQKILCTEGQCDISRILQLI